MASLSIPDAAYEAGITDRQAYYWLRQGWLRVRWYNHAGEEVDFHGSGYRAELTEEGRQHFGWMAQLVRAGILPSLAAKVANAFVRGAQSVRLADGLTLVRGEVDADASL